MKQLTTALAPEDLHALSHAYRALEHPSYAARLSSLLGVPLEEAVKLLPRSWRRRLQAGADAAIARATRAAVGTLREGEASPRRGTHRLLAIGTGAAGGYFGLPGLIVELPITTVLFLRAIADIARSHGEDPASPETRLACVAVFAFGGRSHEDDYAEIGYFEVRSALALHFSTTLRRVMERGAAAETLPAAADTIRLIASRFGVAVSDKAAAQLVPLVGAGAGAAVNAIFMHHFQSVADGHFTVRRLERRYGSETIEAAYAAIRAEDTPPRYRVKPPRA